MYMYMYYVYVHTCMYIYICSLSIRDTLSKPLISRTMQSSVVDGQIYPVSVLLSANRATTCNPILYILKLALSFFMCVFYRLCSDNMTACVG